jgi:hypothetical protein
MIAGAMGALAYSHLRASDDAGWLRTFDTWLVGCDNIQHCRAVGLARDLGGDVPFYLVIDREPGPTGKLRIAGNRDLLPGSQIFVDNRPVIKLDDELLFEAQGNSSNANADFVFPLVLAVSDGEVARKIIEAALVGKQFSLTADPNQRRAVPLEGLKAALRFIDVRQGRAGGVTALVSKGSRPASDVPAAHAAPVAVKKLRETKMGFDNVAEMQAVREYHVNNAVRRLCPESSFSGRWTVEPVRVSESQLIYPYMCSQETKPWASLLYLVESGTPPKISKAIIERLDPKTGLLRRDGDLAFIGHFLGDGNWLAQREGKRTGDCREGQVFRWDGTMFRLVAHVVAPLCPDDAINSAIVLWRTREL